MAQKTTHWKVCMKEKLVNLFLEVHRFSVLNLTADLMSDLKYCEVIADVLFNELKVLRKPTWVKSPTLQTVIRDLTSFLTSKTLQDHPTLHLLKNC